MSKWQQAKIVMQGLAYFGTGIVLILGGLVMLGAIMSALISYYGMAMPMVVRLTPLFIMLVVIGWGAFFIYKWSVTSAGLLLYLIGKATYRILGLHRLDDRIALRIGVAIAMIGFIILCIEVGPQIAANGLFGESSTLVAHPSTLVIGAIILLWGIGITGYVSTQYREKKAREQELATKI